MNSPHVVKVVCDSLGRAMFFSRSCIPYPQGEIKNSIYKHVGIYAYSNSALKKIVLLPPCDLEKAEKLEQLRFLYGGLSVRVHETEWQIVGVDTQRDLSMAAKLVESVQVC